MKGRLPRTYSREEFERLSHPEKLQYLTELLDALEPPRQPVNQTTEAAAGIFPLPVPVDQAED